MFWYPLHLITVYPRAESISVFEESNRISPSIRLKKKSLLTCSILLATLLGLGCRKSRMGLCLVLGSPRLTAGLQLWSEGGEAQPLTCWLHSCKYSPGCGWLSWKDTLPVHVHQIVVQESLWDCIPASQCPPVLLHRVIPAPIQNIVFPAPIFMTFHLSSWSRLWLLACWPLPHLRYCPQTS